MGCHVTVSENNMHKRITCNFQSKENNMHKFIKEKEKIIKENVCFWYI